MKLLLSALFLITTFTSSYAPLLQESLTGMASYYSDHLAGNPTASGQPYDPYKFTAAHRTLPFGTEVRVTNLSNNKTVVVTINDRGPFVNTRIIDLSRAAADSLGYLQKGLTKVHLEILTPNKEPEK